ncbi:uncharacterized protein LOC113205641 isoform X2 [Frankliniella occidentalis]|uniref:Uncharacterized protein LOC113205641 isoform X2 n=1 Tax=Frankliniella occidentalis TaxID=133901 RepID=A0A9C6X813_FRAOC|nr:uncharacterized protein LOC113205641 isoform X2 [Frankliniella occidentalis]
MGKALHTLAIIVATVVAFCRAAHLPGKDEDPFALPENFLIGAGVSAIQTEGAWDADGKLESACDHLLHTGKLASLGYPDPNLHDVAADSYHRYKDDVKMAKALGLQLYRFSVSWSRVYFEGRRIEKGIQYYHNLIKEIKDNGMKPLITMYHFDHPQTYEDEFKGWQSEQMALKFEEYAKFLFEEYGKEVDLWVTMNEPNMYCSYFPAFLFVAAGLYKEEDSNIYRCMRNFVLAHARSYRAFKEAGIAGQIGFNALLMHASPNSTRPEDVYAADLFNQVHAGQVLAPVVLGDYPQVLKDQLGDKLTEFTAEEKKLIQGTTDFIGLNVYFSIVAAWNDPATSDPSKSWPIVGRFVEDLPMTSISMAGGVNINSATAYTRIAPEAMKDAVLWVWNSYKKPIVITESGLGDSLNMGKKDHLRASYHSFWIELAEKRVVPLVEEPLPSSTASSTSTFRLLLVAAVSITINLFYYVQYLINNL